MKIIITGRKVTVKDAFKERVEKKLNKLDKFFDEDALAYVTVSVEKERQTVEVTVKYKGMIYRAEETTKDMFNSFDNAVDALVRQINKNKARLVKRLREGAFEGEEIGPEEDYGEIRVKRFSVKPMSVDEAILEMNMLNHEFFTFLNEESDNICVVYKRRGGGYGVLEPILNK
nr:MAG: ribosome-associated translation inhibitor RaiA [[Clostridium] cellulosi]